MVQKNYSNKNVLLSEYSFPLFSCGFEASSTVSSEISFSTSVLASKDYLACFAFIGSLMVFRNHAKSNRNMQMEKEESAKN